MMTSTEIEKYKKKLESCFEQHQKDRIYFIKQILEKNIHSQDPIDSLFRSLPEKFKFTIPWEDIEAAIDL